MELTGELKQDYASYSETPVENSPALTDILTSLVLTDGPQIYQRTEYLKQTLRQKGISEREISRILLMSQVSGFPGLLKADESWDQNELNLFVQNALRETGLKKTVVLHYTEAITRSLNLSVILPRESLPEKGNKKAYIIPSDYYRTILEKEETGKKHDSRNASLITELAVLGVPDAKLEAARLMLPNLQIDQASEQVIHLLESAAEDGQPEAAAYLGDYYFDKGPAWWGKAFEYYTGFGAIALKGARRKRLVSILNQKNYTGKIFRFSLILTAFFVLSIVLLSVLDLLPANWWLLALCVAGWAGLLGGTAYVFRQRPYASYTFLPASLFAVWFLYLLFQIQFS